MPVVSVSTAIHIPMQLLCLYWNADHPALSTATFSQPLEWQFAEGEVVWEHQSHQKCIIKVVEDACAKIVFKRNKGIKQVSLSDLLKAFHPGAFIEVVGG